MSGTKPHLVDSTAIDARTGEDQRRHRQPGLLDRLQDAAGGEVQPLDVGHHRIADIEIVAAEVSQAM